VFVIILQHTLVFAQGPPAGSQQVLLELFRFRLGGANRVESCLTVSFGGKDSIFIYLNLFSLIIFCIALLNLLEEKVENIQSAVKIVNNHQSKIDVVKFDGMNNFGIWRC